MSIRKAGQVIAGTPNITTGHHVGEIFWTSRLDNELNGAVDANGATYSVEAFTGEKSVPALLADGKLPYVSMAEYESIVSTYGSCRAFGWDNGDTFRVPTAEKMKRILVAKREPTNGNYDWYNLYSDGWLEQGGYIYQAGDVTGVANTTTFPRAFKNNDYSLTMFAGVGNSGWHYANGVGLGISGAGANDRESYTTPTTFTWFNATGVSGAPIFWEAKGYAEIPTEAEYQFQNIETHRAMVQLSTGATDEALMTCTGVLADVADLKQNKLDREGNHTVVETYKNGANWYRIWSDGWIEQGCSTEGSVASLTFLKPFKDTNYTIAGTPIVYSSHGVQTVSITGKTTTGITWAGSNYSSSSWVFCGY